MEWDTNRTKNRHKRKREINNEWQILPFWFYSSRICLILCNKQKMNSIDWKDGYKKRDKENVCEVFKVKSKQLRKILDLLENSFFLLDQQPNTWSEFFKSLPFFSSLLGSLTYSSRFLQPQTQPPSPSAEKSCSADPSHQVNVTRSC